MKRIRTLGLAAILALALTAIVGVSSAAATGFMSGSYPATLKGTASGEHTAGFPGFGNIVCNGPELQATVGAPSETLSTSSVKDSTCTMFGSVPMKSNGCQFTFRPGTKSGEQFNGSFDIGPAGCGPITIGTSTTACEFRIGAQSGLAASYENAGSGASQTMTVKVVATGLKYTKGSQCGGGSFSNGTYIGNWQVKATNSGGTQIGTHVAADNGIHLGGGAPTQLLAEAFPAGIVGSSALMKWKMPKLGSTECRSNQLITELSSTVTDFPLQAAHGECESYGVSSTVSMGSCSYAVHISSGGPPYAGSVDLVCGAGGAIKMTVGQPTVVCTITVPAQTVGTAAFENKGEGTGRYVVASVSGAGVKYSHSGVGCGTGSGESGTLTSSIVLKGLR